MQTAQLTSFEENIMGDMDYKNKYVKDDCVFCSINLKSDVRKSDDVAVNISIVYGHDNRGKPIIVKAPCHKSCYYEYLESLGKLTMAKGGDINARIKETSKMVIKYLVDIGELTEEKK